MTRTTPVLRRRLEEDVEKLETWTSRQGITPKMVKPWMMGPPNTYVLKNANIVDTVRGRIIPGATVTLAWGQIQSIDTQGDRHKSASLLDDAITIDLEGRYVCPGLMDCHVHLTIVPGYNDLMSGGLGPDIKESYFRQPYLSGQMLARGFTTVRDCGGATLALKEAIAEDVFPGPRLFIANMSLSQTGGHGDRRKPHDVTDCCHSGDTNISIVVDGVPAALHAARQQIREGADFIKLLVGGGVASPSDKLDSVQFTAEEVRAVTDVAKSSRTWVTAHAYTPEAIRHAIDNGVTGIEHGNMIDDKTAKLMAEKSVWLTPTLVTYDSFSRKKYQGFLPPESIPKNRAVLEQGLDSLRVARKAGVKICQGSDLLGPLHVEQNREFAIRADALSCEDIVRGTTCWAAEMLRKDQSLGQIHPGFEADLLVLNGNPLEDVTLLAEPEKNILVVMKAGRVYCSRWEGMPTDVKQPVTLS